MAIRETSMQAALWSEFVLDRADLHYQLMPRLLAFAERAWLGPAADWGSFAPRMEAEAAWLAEHDVLGRPVL